MNGGRTNPLELQSVRAVLSVAAKAAYKHIANNTEIPEKASKALNGVVTFKAIALALVITVSSVAAGANIFGADAVLHLSESVPNGFSKNP